MWNRFILSFRSSRKAIAIPMTFLMLFVTTLGLISATYYFAIEKVNAQSKTLKVSTAKQDFLKIDNNILSVAWQPGSARTLEVSDSGGKISVKPNTGALLIRITDNFEMNQTLFNQTTGQLEYQLPYSGSPETGLYLKGDGRPITNQTGSPATQLFISNSIGQPAIVLRYRPSLSFASFSLETGGAEMDVKLYIINLNASAEIELYGKVPLRMSCDSVQLLKSSFNLSYTQPILTLTCSNGEVSGQVTLQAPDSGSGLLLNVETIICNVTVERRLM